MNTVVPALIVGIIGLTTSNLLTFTMLLYAHRRAERLQDLVDNLHKPRE